MDNLSGEDEAIEKGRKRSERRKRVWRAAAWLLTVAIVALSWTLGRSVGGFYWTEIAIPALGSVAAILFYDLTREPVDKPTAPLLWNWIASLCLVVVGFQAVRGAHFRLVFVTDWHRFWGTLENQYGVKGATSHGIALSDGATWGLVAAIVGLTWLLPYACIFLQKGKTHGLGVADMARVVLNELVVGTIGVVLSIRLHATGPFVLYLIAVGLLVGLPHVWGRGSRTYGSVWTLLTLVLLGLIAYHGLRGEHYRAWTLADGHALLGSPSIPPHGVALDRVGIEDGGAWLLTLLLIVCGWLLPYLTGLVRGDPSIQGA